MSTSGDSLGDEEIKTKEYIESWDWQGVHRELRLKCLDVLAPNYSTKLLGGLVVNVSKNLHEAGGPSPKMADT